ncbi:putative transcriptional regulator [Bradyrhizobium sp. USDA 4532]|uniref:helix-turn-helix domain-containing protein n=1 Tax=unclassified Bradyrhizobium TaxID=2631580 RepID=UPI00209D9922|nr:MULTISPECIES: helix-turn-helix domain-containing protein [unclassified Bradyrhizobium]MCP1835363.1 putative transcriptional regulator [Bradyrhizobium sp. USDA 4545]MCP1920109.1 putative transcriptional regulator [Bradyrhizobium sp. USDA 4532]
MTTLGKRLIQSAKEGRAIARGEADPATYKTFVPATIDVKAIRKKVGLTQEEFALRFSVKLASLRDWEQVRYAPDQTARAYLTIIDRDPDGRGARARARV